MIWNNKLEVRLERINKLGKHSREISSGSNVFIIERNQEKGTNNDFQISYFKHC